MKTLSSTVQVAAFITMLGLAAPPLPAQSTWTGGGDFLWSTPANWDVLPVNGTNLVFAGTLNTVNLNNLLTSAGDIAFSPGAGPFVLAGNALSVGGNIANSSSSLQTFSLGVTLSGSAPVLNAGAAGMTFNGSLNGAAAAATMQEVQLLGDNGRIVGAISSGVSNAGFRLRVNQANNTDAWTIGGNSSSSFGGQLFVTRGVMNFGSASEAPNVTMTRVTTGNTGEFLTVGNVASNSGTFNMINGNLILNDGQNGQGSTSVRLALANNTGGGSEGYWNQSGGTVTLVGFTNGSTPGVFGANQSGSKTAFNITGGLFDAVGATFRVSTRGVGELNVSGTGHVRTMGQLTVNDSRGPATAGGTVNLNPGGTLEVGSIRMHRTGSVAANGAATFNFNGGTLKPTANNSSFWNAFTDTKASVQAGGANIDTAGFDISVAMPFSHDAALGANVDGGLIKNGLGALTLGGVNTYTGDTIVNEGALIVNGSLGSAVTVNSGAILGGSGNIAGAVALASGAMLAPGASVGTLTFSGPGGLDVSSAIGGTNVGALVFELVAPASSDQISLAGPLTIGAGALEFNDFSFLTLAGFGAGTYTLIDTTNAISGTLGSGLSGTVGGLDATLGLANGQDIVLNVVPEPATWGLAGIGAFLAICGLRRRRVACRE